MVAIPVLQKSYDELVIEDSHNAMLQAMHETSDWAEAEMNGLAADLKRVGWENMVKHATATTARTGHYRVCEENQCR